MSKQKIVILVLSIIGLASTFLPWVKGFLVGTVVGISGPSVNMDIIWLVIILFLVPILICLISKQEHLRRQTLFWSILPPLVSALIAFLFFAVDLNSSDADKFLGISDASELGLRLGPAPYIIFITGVLISVFGVALKPKRICN